MSVQQLCQRLEPLLFFFFFPLQEACWLLADHISVVDPFRSADPNGFSSAEMRQKVRAEAFTAGPRPNKAGAHFPERLPRAAPGLRGCAWVLRGTSPSLTLNLLLLPLRTLRSLHPLFWESAWLSYSTYFLLFSILFSPLTTTSRCHQGRRDSSSGEAEGSRAARFWAPRAGRGWLRALPGTGRGDPGPAGASARGCPMPGSGTG